jgi:hypothetical protein
MDISGNPVAGNSTVDFEHVCGYVTASTFQEPNGPENTLDGDLSTRWSAEGVQWIKYDLCVVHAITDMEMAFYYGDLRTSKFKVETSNDNANWKEVFNGNSSGTTTILETIDIAESYGRYVKITGNGNSSNAWNSYTEVHINAEVLVVARTELEDLVDSATAIHDAAVEGTGIGEYPQGSRAAFKTAIDSAQAVLDDEDASPSGISMAFAVLMDAMEAFDVDKITGIDDIFPAEVKVYPNPFRQEIYIELPDHLYLQGICLIDIHGRVSAFPAGTHVTALEVENLSPGIYILQLWTDKEIFSKRMIK